MTDASSEKPFKNVALFLQGGGALGAYEAGSYEALDEVGIRPNIVSGISIGAMNGAIIAGNPPEQRLAKLKAFWDKISWDISRSAHATTEQGKIVGTFESLDFTALKGVPGLATPRSHLNIFSQAWRMIVHKLLGKTGDSYYLNSDQANMLKEVIDFDGINSKKYGVEKFAVGTTDAATGKSVFFDNINGVITPDHVMASAAIAPIMPMVKIGDRMYEDGWFSGNDPMRWAHDNHTIPPDTFIINVHLTDHQNKKKHSAPEKVDNANGSHTMNIFYHHPFYELHADSADFSRATRDQRWRAGYEATIKGLCNSGQLDRFSPDVVERLAPHIWSAYPDVIKDLSRKTLAILCSAKVLHSPQVATALANLSPDNARFLNDNYPTLWDTIDPALKPMFAAKLEQENTRSNNYSEDVLARRQFAQTTPTLLR